MKARIVKFKDGRFGIRKWSFGYFGYIFKDLVNDQFWWPQNYKYFYKYEDDIKSEDIGKVTKIYESMYDNGVIYL
jgi:hypothetical protein